MARRAALGGYELTCPPRYGTPRTPGRPTLGPNVAKVQAQLGKPPMPHQRHIFDVAYEIDPDTGMLAYDEVVVIGPRQVTGKTESSFAVMTHRCIGFHQALTEWIGRELGRRVPLPGPQAVLYTAQTADDAKKKWRDVHVARLEKSRWRRDISTRLRTNMEQIRWPNGSTWSPGSTTAKTAGTGDTIDLAFIDEAWAKTDARTELGLRPAMLTRPWRQLWVMSMIPGLSRALPGTWPYLYAKRKAGRHRVEAGITSRVAYFEWSTPRGADPADPDVWWSCMPGLGITVPESSVRSDYATLVETGRLVDFEAEYLGIDPEPGAGGWRVISEPTWRALTMPDLEHRTGQLYLDPCALGVESAPDQSWTSIGVAALTVDGHTFVELVDRRPSLPWAIDALVDLCRRWSVCAIGIAAHGPAASIIEPLRRAMRDADVDTQLVVMQGPEVTKACAQFYAETGEVGEHDQDTGRRLQHLGDQKELNDSVRGLEKYTFGDQWRWQREGGDPLYSVTLARAAGEAVEWVGGEYDVADSLG
jgi:hypothetical protein